VRGLISSAEKIIGWDGFASGSWTVHCGPWPCADLLTGPPRYREARHEVSGGSTWRPARTIAATSRLIPPGGTAVPTIRSGWRAATPSAR